MPPSLAAFRSADALVRERRFDEALAVPGLLPSDRKIIGRRIVAEKAKG